jgi:hypothetical protein
MSPNTTPMKRSVPEYLKTSSIVAALVSRKIKE